MTRSMRSDEMHEHPIAVARTAYFVHLSPARPRCRGITLCREALARRAVYVRHASLAARAGRSWTRPGRDPSRGRDGFARSSAVI